MSIRFQRLIIILLSIIFLFSAILLILFNYNKNIVFFYTPSELFEQKLQINTLVRIGGFVKKNSLILHNQNNKYSFVISDKIWINAQAASCEFPAASRKPAGDFWPPAGHCRQPPGAHLPGSGTPLPPHGGVEVTVTLTAWSGDSLR